jgi:transcriptional regulator with GAF, ATPase, and Fis domain
MDEIQINSTDIVNQSAANQNAMQTSPSGFFVTPDSLTLRSHRTQAEIHAIRQALARTGWIRKRAARILAISSSATRSPRQWRSPAMRRS